MPLYAALVQHANVVEIAKLLIVVQAVADNELVRQREADIVGRVTIAVHACGIKSNETVQKEHIAHPPHA